MISVFIDFYCQFGVQVVVKTINLEISRSRLPDYVEECHSSESACRRIHVQHDYFSSFSLSDCFLVLSLPFPSSLLRLSN